jgi:hypothetical protein
VLHRRLFSSWHCVCLMHVCGWFGGYGGWNMHAIPFDAGGLVLHDYFSLSSSMVLFHSKG